MTLVDAVRLWPTPDANMGTGGRVTNPEHVTDTGLDLRTGRKRQITIADAVRRYPTPAASDHKGSSAPGQRRGQLSEAIEPDANANRGDSTPPMTLNPAWVEWLMGFPIGWTDLEGSATPSCPRSQSGSDDESSKPKDSQAEPAGPGGEGE